MCVCVAVCAALCVGVMYSIVSHCVLYLMDGERFALCEHNTANRPSVSFVSVSVSPSVCRRELLHLTHERSTCEYARAGGVCSFLGQVISDQMSVFS